MKFRITMKTPDSLDLAIRDAVRAELEGDSLFCELETDEVEWLVSRRTEAIRELCRKWFRYGEALVVEVDTEASTCVVTGAP
jgi:hypothetical protein